MCSVCEKNRFFWKGTCDTKCADYQEIGAITVFGIIAVLIVWIVINKSASGEFECLDVGLSYIQIMSAIFTFTSKYGGHSDVYNTIVTISRERSFKGQRATSTIGLLRLVYVSARSGLPLPIS